MLAKIYSLLASFTFFLKIIIYLHSVWLCTCVYMYMSRCTCKSQRIAFGSWLSPSPVWFLIIELRMSASVAGNCGLGHLTGCDYNSRLVIYCFNSSWANFKFRVNASTSYSLSLLPFLNLYNDICAYTHREINIPIRIFTFILSCTSLSQNKFLMTLLNLLAKKRKEVKVSCEDISEYLWENLKESR